MLKGVEGAVNLNEVFFLDKKVVLIEELWYNHSDSIMEEIFEK